MDWEGPEILAALLHLPRVGGEAAIIPEWFYRPIPAPNQACPELEAKDH